jgi:hypothetical protein
MRLKLIPMCGSYDQILIRDERSYACGMLHIDTFMERNEPGPIYKRLNEGEEAFVEVKLIGEVTSEDRDGEEAEATQSDAVRPAQSR